MVQINALLHKAQIKRWNIQTDLKTYIENICIYSIYW